jgi:hypothetical protein
LAPKSKFSRARHHCNKKFCSGHTCHLSARRLMLENFKYEAHFFQKTSQAWWLICIISATWKAKIRRIQVQGQSKLVVSCGLFIFPCKKTKLVFIEEGNKIIKSF